MSDVARRSLWSILVLVAFAASTGVLAWTWWGTQRSVASFSDRETFGTNHLGAGTVDVAIGEGTAGFAAVNMAPGDVATGRLELVNRGTLPFGYSLSSTVGDGPLLAVLDLVAWRGDQECGDVPPSEPARWRPLLDEAGASAGSTSPTIGRLAPGDQHLLCLRATLPLSAPNRFQGERLPLVIAVDAVQEAVVSEGAGQ